MVTSVSNVAKSSGSWRRFCTVTCPYPWGKLPKEISLFNVPVAFQDFKPATDELEHFEALRRQVNFSRWAIDKALFVWYRDPYTPASAPVAPAPPSPLLPPETESLPWDQDSSPAAVAPAPFPPLPPHSKQKTNETIQAFFIRRSDANIKKMANENPTDQQRRKQRADHAKLGQVPSKACVFFWEEQDGHYIRQPGGRGSYAQLWREYPARQRRYDPISNEWDLCELFEDNDPVFGEVCGKVSSHDDNDFEHPTFPQDIDMASLIPREDDNTEVVQKQRPHAHDLEMASIDDVPADEDLGPDFRESDIPTRNLTEASRKCVNLVYLKFGLAPPRTEKPEYESCTGSLSGTLEMRFGFVIPPCPENFVVRDPPQVYFIEVLRQQWGPDIKDIIGHFLARGIPFWLAYVSTEIMPAQEMPAPSTHRPKGFKVDISSGLGFHPEKYKFDEHDYNAYTTQRDLQLLYAPRGRIALQYGRVIGRLARSEVSDDDFFRGFSDNIYDVGDCLWDGTSQYAYWHNRLSEHEIDLLCGVYHVATGM
ncbi:hypothetical protein FB451DRAFT_1020274 [Mycena latifolia]|nr:hypothetical protein FB451DRAFT_1020274 [Mycena latifolia]